MQEYRTTDDYTQRKTTEATVATVETPDGLLQRIKDYERLKKPYNTAISLFAEVRDLFGKGREIAPSVLETKANQFRQAWQDFQTACQYLLGYQGPELVAAGGYGGQKVPIDDPRNYHRNSDDRVIVPSILFKKRRRGSQVVDQAAFNNKAQGGRKTREREAKRKALEVSEVITELKTHIGGTVTKVLQARARKLGIKRNRVKGALWQ